MEAAVTFLDAAEAVEVNLGPNAAKRHLGLASPSIPLRAREIARRATPFMKTEAQVTGKIVGYLEKRESGKQMDAQQSARMDEWFSALSGSEREAVYIAPAESQGSPDWLQPLTLRVQGQPQRQFDAGHLVNWPPHVLEALPNDVRAKLTARHEMLSALGVESGAEVVEFIDDHFEQETFDLDDAPPLEIERLCELDPKAASALRALQQSGAKLTLVRCKQTPGAVSDAVRIIANASQHNFVSTWMPTLVLHGIEPKMIDTDKNAVRERHGQRQDKVDKKFQEKDPFRHALETRQLENEFEGQTDIQPQIDLIKEFGKSGMFVTAASPNGEPLPQLASANGSLGEYFGREYARRRFMFDDAKSTSEGGAKILKGYLGIAVLADVLEKKLHLNAAAKTAASMLDDVTGEAAEGKSLSDSGFPLKQIVGRLGVVVPAAVTAMVMASEVDNVMSQVNDNVGGALYSTSAVLLSGVTAALTTQIFVKGFKKLKREGKLPPDLVLDNETLALIEAHPGKLPSKDQLIKSIDESLERGGASDGERAAVRDRLSKFSERKLWRKLRRELGVVSMNPRPIVASLKESVGANAMRLGLMLGVAGSPVFGAAAGPLFLHNPFAYAAAGSVETISGIAALSIFLRTFNQRWRHSVRGQQPKELPASVHGESDSSGPVDR